MRRIVLLSGVVAFVMAFMGTILAYTLAVPILAQAQQPGIRGEEVSVVGDNGADRVSLYAHAQPTAPISLAEHAITLDAANTMITASVARARELGLAEVIVVVDGNGLLKAMVRMDGARLPSISIAHDKAYTAAVQRRTSEAFANSLLDSPIRLHSVAAQPHTFLGPGGIPIVVEGQVIGAIGASGGSGVQDVEVATAGLAAIQ